MDKNIYVIHENDEWLVPLRESFKKIKAPFKEWHMDKESFDFKKSPPNGIFYNRMSASAHSRGHRYAPENTKEVLSWLEKDKKRVVNNSRALELEISKQIGSTIRRSKFCKCSLAAFSDFSAYDYGYAYYGKG